MIAVAAVATQLCQKAQACLQTSGRVCSTRRDVRPKEEKPLKLGDVAQALTDIGPRLEPIAILEDEVQNYFSVHMDERTEIQIEPDPDRGLLIFIGNLGKARDEQAALKLCVFLMEFNALSGAMDGHYFSYAVDEDFQIMMDVAFDALEVDDLEFTISAFAERISFWRSVVERGAPENNPQPPEGENFENLIRV